MSECQYCKKDFKSERTLSAHMCVKKKRMLEKETIGSRLGFFVFQRFYDLTTNAKKQKTIDDFINSRYYLSFVKFGRHLADLRPIDSNAFVDYVINNGIDINDWHKDSTYFLFLKHHMEEEPYERAIERTLFEMQKWADDNGCSICDFFRNISTFEIVNMIKSGRISPWVIYLTNSGVEMLEKFSDEQLAIISDTINSDFWKNKFLRNRDDVIFVQQTLNSFNL